MATSPPVVTYGFMVVNVAVFLAFLGGDGTQNVDYGLHAFPIHVFDEWYRVFTSAFLHANLAHIAFNMYALYKIGPVVERALGWWRFTAVYVISLLGGSLGALILEPLSITVGASGAVFGLMGALYVLSQRRGVDPWSTGLGGVILLNLFITFTIPIISIGGHVGGLIAGGLAILVVDQGRSVTPRKSAFAAAIMFVAVVGLVTASLIVSGNAVT